MRPWPLGLGVTECNEPPCRTKECENKSPTNCCRRSKVDEELNKDLTKSEKGMHRLMMRMRESREAKRADDNLHTQAIKVLRLHKNAKVPPLNG